MNASAPGCEPSNIPEYRLPVAPDLKFDLSREDAFLGPVEPELSVQNWRQAAGEARLEPGGIALLRAFALLLPEGGRALLFEPTRPDIRFAILQRGASYIDGGRLMDGRPDPAVLKYVENHPVDLMIFEMDDPIPPDLSAPVLVDTRAFPYRSETRFPGRHTLRALGPRDGFLEHHRVWVEDPKGESIDSGSEEERQRVNSAARQDSGFDLRAQERIFRLEQCLALLEHDALDAGFEGMQRAGFLWVGLPGFTGMQLQRAFARADVGVFACAHHPYRHRIRLTPPDLHTILQQDLRSTSTLALTFSQAYKNLTL